MTDERFVVIVKDIIRLLNVLNAPPKKRKVL